jgi:hypothetical protein
MDSIAMPIELRDCVAALPLWHSAQTLSPTSVTPGGILVGVHLSTEIFCPEVSEVMDVTLKTIPQISRYARQAARLEYLFPSG